ncbi:MULTISPECIES: TRAP transporter small permease subunit [unclassified Leptolyngbya]|uniref:TRAP transporter small permease subunit n=1 Tax=unclassified Leptolyngbya TaxID=2650499 RepID=UPI001682B9BB|nr:MULTISPECIES: TRAP transporter small permease subunit [unclassified Leptolyngbya]MBD1910039.1 TRAP transporter small permease subunit [Leptolyngbya sp. FACHB-8]MBD2153056.1 TRAP transporter small permease subunit [Leptolyngbya sp. FACHB-16]
MHRRSLGPVRALLRLSEAIDRLTDWVGQLSVGLVVLTIAISFYNVLVRYVGRFIGLQLSSNVLIELQWYLFAILFLLGFAYILKHDQNVRVDFWYAHWSDRRRTWVNLLGTLLFLIPFCILGLYVTFNPVLASWGRLPDGTWGPWEVSSDANGLPRAPIKAMVLVGLALLLLQAISQSIKYTAVLLGYNTVTEQIQQDTEQLPYE